MTYILNLKPETAQRIEEKARQSGVAPQQWLESVIENASAESITNAKFEEVMNGVFDRYQRAFEVLAEGAK